MQNRNPFIRVRGACKDCGKSGGRCRWKRQRLYATAIAEKEEYPVRNSPFRWNKETDKQFFLRVTVLVLASSGNRVSSRPSGLSCSRNSSMIWCKCSSLFANKWRSVSIYARLTNSSLPLCMVCIMVSIRRRSER